MTPVWVFGVGVTSNDVRGVGKGLEGLVEPLLEDGVGGCRVLFVSSVDRDDSCLMVWVERGADVNRCGGEVGGPGGVAFVYDRMD